MSESKTRDQIRQEIQDMLAASDTWKSLAGTEGFKLHVESLADIAYRAEYRVSRAEQERTLATAVRRSSILAKAQDRQYIPVKPSPSFGKVMIKNTGTVQRPVPANFALVSEKQVSYMIMGAATIAAGDTVEIDLKQLKAVEQQFTITEKRAHYEIELDQQYSAQITDIEVWVDQGFGFRQWDLKRRFRNAAADTLAWEEFYTVSDQVGIRFGNGVFGAIPEVGSLVQVKLRLTDGPTTLTAGAKLRALRDQAAVKGLEFTVSQAVIGGQTQEDMESIRINSLHHELFNEEYVWANDYSFKLRSIIPQITWLEVWGESKEEKRTGVMSVDNINTIHVSVMAPGLPDTESVVLEVLNALPTYNTHFKFHPPQLSTYSVAISGKLLRSKVLVEVKQQILNALTASYSLSSLDRKARCLEQDVYRILNSLDAFRDDEPLTVTISGTAIPTQPLELCHIDIVATEAALNLTY